ncbi:MAG: Gfo/Idh/MocA family protein, partial [Chloroflexota bacterium]
MREITVGVIGCGIGQLHVEGFAADPRVKLAAIAGLDVDRCAPIQTKHLIPQRYEDYRELLADPAIDMVSVGVPNHLHREVTVAALEAGKHVLVEKPLAQNSTEGAEMVKAAKRSGKQLGIIFNRRGRHDVQIVRSLVHRGELGEIYHAKAYWCRRTGSPKMGTWFVNKRLAGGGCMLDIGVHFLDLALYIT